MVLLRGMVHICLNLPERLFDFTITGTVPVAFVKIRFCEKILNTVSDIAKLYEIDIHRLRLVTK